MEGVNIMITIVHYIIFLLITIYILLKVIGYGIYEIKQENNKFGGIVVISFSCLVVIFANLVLWFK